MTSCSSPSLACTPQPTTIGQNYQYRPDRRDHSYPLPAPRTLLRRSCLRKESAFTYDGTTHGSRLNDLPVTKMITVSYSLAPKKTISFADQRGQHLVLEREFSPADAPVCYCDVPIEVTAGRLTRRRRSILDKWLEDTVTGQHLLSICIVSLLGCALIGLRQTAK